MLEERECIIFRGSKDGVSIVIDEETDFDTVLERLREKLLPSGDFFRGAHVLIDSGNRLFDEDECSALTDLVAEYGISVEKIRSALEVDEPSADGVGMTANRDHALHKLGRVEPTEGAGVKDMFPGEYSLLIKRTMRSGQRIEYDGNVVVLGDVNPGAVITCTGDIVVLGTLRGLAHAGAAGDETAQVVALRLEATQLRIGGLISRAPDGDIARPSGPEVARVRGRTIQVEAYVP